MKVDTRTTVAKNLQALFRAARRGTIDGPVSSNALQEQMRSKTGSRETTIDRRTVDRALDGANAVSVDTLAVIAEAFELEPWHLLVPGLDPEAPPVLLADREAVRDARVAREIQRRAHAVIHQMGEPIKRAEHKAAKSTTGARRRKAKA
jgi:hypothetical protein